VRVGDSIRGALYFRMLWRAAEDFTGLPISAASPSVIRRQVARSIAI
jgi:hypothetical protein